MLGNHISRDRINVYPEEPPSNNTETVDNLNIESGVIKPVVVRLAGTVTITQMGNRWDPWYSAFDRQWGNPRVLDSLDVVIQNVGQAIGKIQDKSWLEKALDYTRDKNPEKVARTKIFVAHDGESSLRNKLELELWGMGLEPVIAEGQPSPNEAIDDKVDRLLEECEFGIVLARYEMANEQGSQRLPRANLIDEIARIRARMGERFIILLEDGLTFPSNQLTGVTFEPFKSENPEAILLKIIKSLRANDIL